MYNEFLCNINKLYPELDILVIKEYGRSTINKLFVSEKSNIIIKLYSEDYGINDSIYSQILAFESDLAPQIYRNCNGKYISKFGSKQYIIQQFITSENYLLNDIDLLIDSLNDLHLRLRMYKTKYQFAKKIVNKSTGQILQTICDDKKKILSQCSATYNTQFSKLLELRQKLCIQYNIMYNPLNYEIIHGDVRPSNILFHNNRIYFIDFDYVCLGDILFEIGSAAMLFSSYNIDGFRTFINKYLKITDLKLDYTVNNIVTNLLSYYVQSSFPIKLIGIIDDKALEKMVMERIKALEFCDLANKNIND